MLTEEQEALLERKAYELKDFTQSNGQTLGIRGASDRLSRWVANFESCGIPAELAAELVRGITFIADQTIIDGCMRLLNQIADPSAGGRYYCAFGEENESSARIMRTLNSDPKCRVQIADALELIRADGAPAPTLVFIDDFINSGGQFERIVGQWFDGRHLNPDQQELLKGGRLLFLFGMGMEHGRLRAETLLQKHALNGQIRVLNQYPCHYGSFGSEDDIRLMRQRSAERLQFGLFKGWEAQAIAPLLELCENVGKQLLAKTHPHWNDERIHQCALGYGGNAQLFLNQNNVPTCTLTPLWLGGRVVVDGRDVVWEPLVPRRSKTKGGSEGRVKPVDGMDVGGALKKMPLDDDAGSDVPLEVILMGQARGNLDRFRPFQRPDFRLSRYYDAVLPADLLENILTGLDARRLSAQSLNQLNNHLHWPSSSPDSSTSVRLASVDVLAIDQDRLLYGARFKVNARGTSLHDALALIHHMQVAEKPSAHRLDFAHSQSLGGQRETVCRSARDLVHAALAQVDPDIRTISLPPRPLVFVRTGSPVFGNSHLRDRLFAAAASLHNPGNLGTTIPMPAGFQFEFDGRAAVTANGTLLFCGAGPTVNRSHLQEEMATVYYFQEAVAAVSGWRNHGKEDPAESPLVSMNRALKRGRPVENSHLREHRVLLTRFWGLEE